MEDFVFDLDEIWQPTDRKSITITGSLKLDNLCPACYAKGVVAHKHTDADHGPAQCIKSWDSAPTWLRAIITKIQTDLRKKITEQVDHS